MTAQASLAETTTGRPTWAVGSEPAASDGPSAGQLRARVSRPHRDALVVTVEGEVDAATVGQLHEVLWPRLSAAVATVVVQLTEVGFLGVAGLALLHQAQLRAQAQGLALGLVPGDGEAARAVHMCELDQQLPCFATTEQALHRFDGRA